MIPTEQRRIPTDCRNSISDIKRPVDISIVQIDKSKPVEERIKDYIALTGNPYNFVCGKTAVEICFASAEAQPLDKIIIDYFTRKKAHK